MYIRKGLDKSFGTETLMKKDACLAIVLQQIVKIVKKKNTKFNMKWETFWKKKLNSTET